MTIKRKTTAPTIVPAKSLLRADQISIEKFRLVKGLVDAHPDFNPSLIKGYALETDFDMGFILAKDKVRSTFRLEIVTESETGQKGEAKGSFELYYFFDVDNLKTLAEHQKDGFIKVNPDLANAIASVTYSTTRGMLMARLQSTALENFILPVVNPNDLLKGKEKKPIKKS